jgi:hypothetical protein
MNERIRELAEQASEIMENTESQVVIARFGSNPSLQDLEDLWNEKFALLIVQECMSCSTWVGKINTNLVEPVHTAHAINQRIKEQFGVEE